VHTIQPLGQARSTPNYPIVNEESSPQNPARSSVHRQVPSLDTRLTRLLQKLPQEPCDLVRSDPLATTTAAGCTWVERGTCGSCTDSVIYIHYNDIPEHDPNAHEPSLTGCPRPAWTSAQATPHTLPGLPRCPPRHSWTGAAYRSLTGSRSPRCSPVTLRRGNTRGPRRASGASMLKRRGRSTATTSADQWVRCPRCKAMIGTGRATAIWYPWDRSPRQDCAIWYTFDCTQG
jgi:hypothetical protein